MAHKIDVKRMLARGFDKIKGERRFHHVIEDKISKYEDNPAASEFIPVMMHMLKRYCADLPEGEKNSLDVSLTNALDAIPDAKDSLCEAVEKYEAIPHEIKRRAFSPTYLDLATDQAIDVSQLQETLQTAIPEVPGVAEAAPAAAFGVTAGLPMASAIERFRRTLVKPPRNKYELSFSHLYCVDESNPEFWGSDEPYVVFGVISEEMSESGIPAKAFTTPIYGGVDDGDRRPEQGDEGLRIYGETGPIPITSPVAITATCMEHDIGDVEDEVKKVAEVLTAVAKVVCSVLPVPNWIVLGLGQLEAAVSFLFDIWFADDQIGETITMTLTQATADQLTRTVQNPILPPLHFDGGDGDGIYDVYLRLTRR